MLGFKRFVTLSVDYDGEREDVTRILKQDFFDFGCKGYIS